MIETIIQAIVSRDQKANSSNPSLFFKNTYGMMYIANVTVMLPIIYVFVFTWTPEHMFDSIYKGPGLKNLSVGNVVSKNLRDRILELLSSFQGERIPQSYIHRALGASKSRVSEILSELERDGLIKRYKIGRTSFIHVYKGIKERENIIGPRTLRIGIVYSSEYLFLGFLSKKFRDNGLDPRVIVYDDGLDVIKAIAHGEIDLGLSPLVGQLYLYPVYRSYRILARGMSGGFKALYREGLDVVYSTRLSTMDYVRYTLSKDNVIGYSKTMYYSSPSQLLNKALKTGGYVITWHPLYRVLVEKEFREIEVYENNALNGVCCSLAVSNIVPPSLRSSVVELYENALSDYSKNPDKFLEYYSAITGINTSVLKTAINDYKVSQSDQNMYINEILSMFTAKVLDKDIYKDVFIEDT
ncbi:MAG: MarR family transcriptional regulator [Desulfurococcaceae archaeon]